MEDLSENNSKADFPVKSLPPKESNDNNNSDNQKGGKDNKAINNYGFSSEEEEQPKPKPKKNKRKN